MDCLCCVDGGSGPASNADFLGSVCHLQSADGTPAKFPAEADRYVLYVIAGCPFAARPWALQAIYGLPIQIVKLFPASYDQGWFWKPTSDGETKLVSLFPDAQVDADPLHEDSHHLKQLYVKANPEFEGAVSVPLLWDKINDTAVSNSSLGLAQMMEQQMKSLAVRNKELDLFPTEPDSRQQEHTQLVHWIHANITTAVYRINASQDGTQHDQLVMEYYNSLTELQDRIDKHGKWLLEGDQPTFADIVLWISLIRLDLAYQWRFGLGHKNVREDYPRLQTYVQDVMSIEGIQESVLPRDLMALYFMTKKWNDNDKGRTLPLVPAAWSKHNAIP